MFECVSNVIFPLRITMETNCSTGNLLLYATLSLPSTGTPVETAETAARNEPLQTSTRHQSPSAAFEPITKHVAFF